MIYESKWSGRKDSNLRPPGPKQTRRSTRLSYAPLLEADQTLGDRYSVKQFLPPISLRGLFRAFFSGQTFACLGTEQSPDLLLPMDSISSADLDTTSKTPMFIGIAGIIIGVAGAILGWLGFSKASALEAELSQVTATTQVLEDLQATVEATATMAKRSAGDTDSLKATVNKLSGAISKDLSGVKKDMRSIAIQAGTALKKLEVIEEKGLTPVRAAAAKPSSSATERKGSNSSPKEATAAPEGTEIYTIKKGDMLYRVASNFKVSLDEITAANPGIDINRLQIGQEIVIPKK